MIPSIVAWEHVRPAPQKAVSAIVFVGQQMGRGMFSRGHSFSCIVAKLKF